jgi:hypothetical protein
MKQGRKGSKETSKNLKRDGIKKIRKERQKSTHLILHNV